MTAMKSHGCFALLPYCLAGILSIMITGSMIQGQESDTKVTTAAELKSSLQNQLLALNVSVSQRAPSVDLFSKRGDLQFFLGRFSRAVNDYQEMVKLDPQQDTSHWRLGIALFYSGDANAAAAQFDRYHSFDDVDRENGIWRYFSHYKANGPDAARKQLLKYEKDDREPFGDVYKLFSGEMTGQEILIRIQQAEISLEERQKRHFYANLYIGLNDVLEGHSDAAKAHLQAAVDNPWPQAAGYGPSYMWHVGRVQLDLLNE